ncbi:MAG: LPS export ABC transporter permease LptF, partial [Pseudomonadota bacterium]
AVLLMVTIGARFISYLQDAALGKFPADGIARILLYRLPGFLQLLLPFAWFLTLLLTLGRLYAESEFDVLKSGGVGPGRVLVWVLPVTLIVSALVGLFSISLAPDNDRKLTEYFRAQRANAEFALVNPGVFNAFYGGRRVTYADAVEGEILKDVFLAELKPDSPPVTVRAEQGGQSIDAETGTRYLVLTNGHRYVGQAGDPDYQIVSFGQLRQRLEEGTRKRALGVEAWNTADLLERGDAEAWGELHFRLALPLVVLIATLVAVGVSRTKPREGRFARMLPGVGLFVLYYAAIVFNRNAISDGQLPVWAGMWAVHGAFLVTGVVLLRHSIRPAKV